MPPRSLHNLHLRALTPLSDKRSHPNNQGKRRNGRRYCFKRTMNLFFLFLALRNSICSASSGAHPVAPPLGRQLWRGIKLVAHHQKSALEPHWGVVCIAIWCWLSWSDISVNSFYQALIQCCNYLTSVILYFAQGYWIALNVKNMVIGSCPSIGFY